MPKVPLSLWFRRLAAADPSGWLDILMVAAIYGGLAWALVHYGVGYGQ
jgi:uncharacterized membrane protein YhaH (DUF805 family)